MRFLRFTYITEDDGFSSAKTKGSIREIIYTIKLWNYFVTILKAIIILPDMRGIYVEDPSSEVWRGEVVAFFF